MKPYTFIAAICLSAATAVSCASGQDTKPDRIILLTLDGMTSGLHERVDMPNFTALMREGVLFKEVHLPLAAHPSQSEDYPWSSSIPNPVLMSGTIFIGQSGVADNLIQSVFTERTTAFTVNSVSYRAIRDGFALYSELPKGVMNPVYTDELPIDAMKGLILSDDPVFMRIHCQGLGSSGSRTQEPDKPFTNNIWHPESPWRLQARHVDSLLGEFTGWLKDRGLWESSVLIVMGDHGQADQGWHEPYASGSRTTQMLVAGKGIRKNTVYDYAEIIDVVPTIAWLQKVPAPKFSQGRILAEVTEGGVRPESLPMPMKMLNEALLKYRANNPDSLPDRELNIEMIARWHEGSTGNDYEAFVRRLTEKTKGNDAKMD